MPSRFAPSPFLIRQGMQGMQGMQGVKVPRSRQHNTHASQIFGIEDLLTQRLCSTNY